MYKHILNEKIKMKSSTAGMIQAGKKIQVKVITGLLLCDGLYSIY